VSPYKNEDLQKPRSKHVPHVVAPDHNKAKGHQSAPKLRQKKERKIVKVEPEEQKESRPPIIPSHTKAKSTPFAKPETTPEKAASKGTNKEEDAVQPTQAKPSDAKELTSLNMSFKDFKVSHLQHSWEIDASEILFVTKIGNGTNCTVYQGTYRNQLVALKVLKDINKKQMDIFKQELAVISSIRSPDVVFFFGACLEPKPLMVLGYCSMGSLYDVLSNPQIQITWPIVNKIAMQTIRGLKSLHSWVPQIVHRDLKSRNILMEDNFQSKLCDFGESRFLTTNDLESLCKVRGTYAYISPEVYFGQAFTTKSDVYAFGVILWELCNRCCKGVYEAPYSEYKQFKFDFQIIVWVSKKGWRPTIPKDCPVALANLILRCWANDPVDRPETGDLLKFFEEILTEPDASKWLTVPSYHFAPLPAANAANGNGNGEPQQVTLPPAGTGVSDTPSTPSTNDNNNKDKKRKIKKKKKAKTKK